MLLWINGPFGGGKTATAYEVQRRLAGSVVCDPEEPGMGLHRMTPPALRGDFQDLRAWRQGVVEVLDLVLSRHRGTVLAPMTVVEPAYLDETVGRLRHLGHDVRHVTLLAEPTTVVRRLRGRGLGPLLRVVAGEEAWRRREEFALARVDSCLQALAHPRFAEHVWTDHLSVPQVADRIAALNGLVLAEDTDGLLTATARRVRTSVRHIRRD